MTSVMFPMNPLEFNVVGSMMHNSKLPNTRPTASCLQHCIITIFISCIRINTEPCINPAAIDALVSTTPEHLYLQGWLLSPWLSCYFFMIFSKHPDSNSPQDLLCSPWWNAHSQSRPFMVHQRSCQETWWLTIITSCAQEANRNSLYALSRITWWHYNDAALASQHLKSLPK